MTAYGREVSTNMSDQVLPVVDYFSDVLCVWAYGAQPRLDELKAKYSGRITVRYRFIPLFAAAHDRIEARWSDRGGFAGFNRHVRDIAARWDHLSVHPDVWLREPPVSSTGAHIFLKAIQLLREGGMLSSQAASAGARDQFEEAVWRVRCAFFEGAQDVGKTSILDEIARSLGLPLDAIRRLSHSGEAHAALHSDLEAKEQYRVQGSPTLILNEGRQHLYGNVGYRIIEANVRELLHNPSYGEASWC